MIAFYVYSCVEFVTPGWRRFESLCSTHASMIHASTRKTISCYREMRFVYRVSPLDYVSTIYFNTLQKLSYYGEIGLEHRIFPRQSRKYHPF